MSTKSVREMMSDPGKYKLEKDRTCASVSDNAFGKSERSGSQGFVSVSKRPEFGILHKMRDRQKMATLSSIMPRFRGDETISPGPAGHVPNNHTLERGARESCRDYRAMTGTREDLFRTPRVKPRIKTPRETVRV